ncbi:phosphatidylinositol glycan, class P [Angomonas deanei]|uniref:PIG-P, putative n=1 Tax=Angomonas deanei TaxID=59799 RepID=S9WY84_9TRYP|nr:phosphatidylinositol glycan, class P [Angomonas deanei]EPY41055.1 phosphatidylinositol glycan, class P [Angomonas deanei]CAD2213051.1 PIG-P, putative [Angomonas deanei]|eukprot:EPY39193.1 phosphatidylinositol glycan, class P [Angomonas deanei]
MPHTGEQKGEAQVAITGFISCLLVLGVFGGYLVWAIVPDEYLHLMHITYLPSKYWAVAIPAVIIMTCFYYWVASVLIVLVMTYPLTDGHCVTDVDKKKEAEVKLSSLSGIKSSVPPWVDIPVDVTSALLFQPWKN